MAATRQADALERLRALEHGQCLLCGAADSLQLSLRVVCHTPGHVVGRARPGGRLQSYPHELHGGIVSLLMDGIMTNCLFAEGIVAVTAQLRVRYLHPVLTGRDVELQASLVSSKKRVHYLESTLIQDGEPKVRGWATFIERK